MKNTITLLLITVTTLSHGMETLFQDKKRTICFHQQLYSITVDPRKSYELREFATNINRLSKLNQFFHTYYSQEKTGQMIVNCISHPNSKKNNQDDVFKATEIGSHINRELFRTIKEKIFRLFYIAHSPNEPFTTQDLSDHWYVNAKKDIDATLLSSAYENKEMEKTKALINAKADARDNINNGLLNRIIEDRSYSNNEHYKKDLLIIAELLLDNGADPDFRFSDEHFTPLIKAARASDTEYARLLIWYNADPKKVSISRWYNNNIVHENIHSSFDYVIGGTLKKIVNEKQQIVRNCRLFKHHNFDEATLHPEIIKEIIFTVWVICKNPLINKHTV